MSTTYATGIPVQRTPPTLTANSLDLFSLKGKTALITGASAGIGLAVAEAFAEAGANIVLGYNSSAAAEQTAAALAERTGVTVVAVHCPVTDPAAIDRAFEVALAKFKVLDIVVANAGITWTGGAVLDPPDHAEWHKVVDVDLHGSYYTAKATGLIFKRQGFGSLIFTSSISAKIVNIPQMQTAYNISKAAVTHMTKCLAVEWAGFGRVNCISPGYTITEITKFADQSMREQWLRLTPMGREASPRELVGAYMYLASDASTYTTGTDLVIDGGYTLV
ncbi:uncharacterized protein V1510DRAFT_410044 [Dipodascopsis tothii]|uniref:uncharacterized protein n=1 Tax=Dipodascopsis tothii TaxID=44089 RepID=UPI0034CFD9F9